MIRRHARVIWTLSALFTLCSVHGAWAGAPTDQLREGVERVISILRDPELKGDRQIDQRRAAVAQAAGEIFDFGEMAKRCLAQHWDKRSPAEQKEFVRLDQHAATALMTYRGETVDDDYAVVQTTIPLSNGNALPLDYRMHNTRDHWQVYDFSMGGISLVANYRAQFKAESSAPSVAPADSMAAR